MSESIAVFDEKNYCIWYVRRRICIPKPQHDNLIDFLKIKTDTNKDKTRDKDTERARDLYYALNFELDIKK